MGSSKRNTKRVILGAVHSIIEPLGLLHLSAIARQEGFEPTIILSKRDDLGDIEVARRALHPDFVGLTVYTGSHQNIFKYFDRLRTEKAHPPTILGGPHATIFPKESLTHADYVVVSEGLNSFRRILRGVAKPGILLPQKLEQFPMSDRNQFYRDHPSHAQSPVKSTFTNTGCPWDCAHCYNSSNVEQLEGVLSSEELQQAKKVLGERGRLFAKSSRSVEEVLTELEHIQKISPDTQLFFFQDDVFLRGNVRDLEEFASKYPKRVGLPFHAQTRVDYIDISKDDGRKRLDLMREAGCTGLTLAIESGNRTIREEVLGRRTDEELMFRAFSYMARLGYKLRTEQMLGLPTGATSQETPINIEADLETLKLNVELKRATKLPTYAWASIFVPYMGTRLGMYCDEHGFYHTADNNDTPPSFFSRSVLRFPKQWVGLSLSAKDSHLWLSEPEQEAHRTQVQLLRDIFDEAANTPQGHILARQYLKGIDVTDTASLKLIHELSATRRHHMYDILYGIKPKVNK